MWFFNSPKIIFGEEALSWLADLEGERAYIVTDPTMLALGFVERVQAVLDLAGISSRVFAEVEPDPCLETVQRCAREMPTWAPDWIIGLGGGSCLDAARAAWFLYKFPEGDLASINPFEVYHLRSKARLITIPTTSGTGADVSWGFALANPAEGSKLVRVSYELIPDISIVDPAFVANLPAQLTADTGMDVLTHAIEAYTCNWHNDFTDGLALKAIELVFTWLPRAVANGDDLEAREHMHNAATIAGLAFSNNSIILAHTLGHAFGGVFNTHHGRTVGTFLPYTIEYIEKTASERYAQIAHFMHLPGETTADLLTAIRTLQDQIGQPKTLAELGVPRPAFEVKFQHLVSTALNSIELTASPRIPLPHDLERLFSYAWEGKRIDF